MKKRSSNPLPSTVDSSAPSPSSSSSSSSCVVDYDDHDHSHDQRNDEDEKPPKLKRPRRKRVSINTKAGEKFPIAIANRRSSVYRGVTRHRWTVRFEAHLWDKSCWNSIQNKKGRQVYLGAYDSEVDAARTYDLAALKYWGPETTLNFLIENYTKEIEEMQNVTKEEYLASLRRRSSGFSRGVSKYRGVARHHHNGRWEARIGRVFGNKYLYLGTFSSQEEAAAAYDLAAIEYRGTNAVTNFDINNYIGRVKNLIPTDQSQPPTPSQTKPIQQQKEEEPPCKQEVQQEVVEQQEQIVMLSKSQDSSTSVDHSSLLAMSTDDYRENPWSFWLDNGGFDPLLLPDIPLEGDDDVLDLFDQTGFEDDIGLIFEAEGNSIRNVGCHTEVIA